MQRERYINHQFIYINCKFKKIIGEIQKMKEITENEMKFILTVFRNPKEEYNARNISKVIGISHMGALKIAVRLEKEGIIKSRLVGKARIYSLNLEDGYVNKYIEFLLQREAEKAPLYSRVWIKEIRKIKDAQASMLFGSVLTKGKEANDIDVLIIVNEKNLEKVQKEIEEVNLVNNKRLHPVFQTIDDIKSNIKKGDKVILNALNGIVAKGEEVIIGAIK